MSCQPSSQALQRGARVSSEVTLPKTGTFQERTHDHIRPVREARVNSAVMGRQTRFHMLPDDCRRFVQFLQERDPVIVTNWHSSSTPEPEECVRPWETGGMYCLWNQAILPELRREATGAYFNISFSAAVIELSYRSPVVEAWNGQPALIQGRIWTGFRGENKAFQSWYNAAVRWIIKNFVRDQALSGISTLSVQQLTSGFGMADCCFRISGHR